MSMVSSRLFTRLVNSPRVLNSSRLPKLSLGNARFSPGAPYSNTSRMAASVENSIESASPIAPKDFYMPSLHTKEVSAKSDGNSIQDSWRALLNAHPQERRISVTSFSETRLTPEARLGVNMPLDRSTTVRESNRPSLLSRLRRTKSSGKLTQTDPPTYMQANRSMPNLGASSPSSSHFASLPGWEHINLDPSRVSSKAPTLYSHQSGATSWDEIPTPTSFYARSIQGKPSPSASSVDLVSRPTSPFQLVNPEPQGVVRPYAASFAYRQPYNHHADHARNALAWQTSPRRQQPVY